MVPSALPILATLQALMDRLAASSVVLWHLHAPGRWVVALAAVGGGWFVGRVAGGLIGAIGRWALLALALWFAYTLLRA